MRHALYHPLASLRSVPLTLTYRAKLYVHAWQVSNASDLPLAVHVDSPPLVQYVDTPSPGRRRIRTSVESGQTNMTRIVRHHALLRRVQNRPLFLPKS